MVEHLGSSRRGMNETDAGEGPSQGVRKQKPWDVLKTQFKQDRDKEREDIQHTRVEISKTARFRDRTKQKLGLEVSKRTPERVNEQVGRFKNALRKIGNKSNYLDYLPRDLRSLFIEVVKLLPVRFQAALGNAVDSYDSSNLLSRLSKYKVRHNAQDSLEELNAQLNDMMKVLDGWRYMTTVSERASSAISASRLDITLTGIESPGTESLKTINDQLDKAQEECKKALEHYREGSAQPDEWKPFKDILECFKQPMKRWEDQITEPDRHGYLEAFFKNHFIFHLIERNIDPADLPSSIHRRMRVIEVGEKHGDAIAKAFAIAKGKTVEEKVKRIPIKNSAKNFADRYYIAKEKGITCIRVKTSTDTPYSYILKRIKRDLIVIGAYKDQDISIVIEGTNRLPHSEVTYNLLSIKNFFNLKRIIRRFVSNQETRYIIQLFQYEQLFRAKQYNSINIFKNGNDGYYAMLGSPNVSGPYFLLKQHKDKFPHKGINDIKWEDNDLKIIIGNEM